MDGEMPYMLKKNIAYKYKVSITMATGGSNCNCNNQEGGAKKKTSTKKRKLSPYNIFMKTEIKKVKKDNPKLSHQQAFKKAAGNWGKK
jgi:hypothetical protein